MPNALIHPKGTGLQATPHDEHDFLLAGIAGIMPPSGLPKSFMVSEPLVIKDQGYGTDCCTGEALTAVAEDEDGTIFDPLYTFARTKAITGDLDGWGADLRSACKSATKFGFLPIVKELVEKQVTMEDRDRAVHGGYADSFDKLAAPYKKQSYFSVNGPRDFFDNVRSALYQTRTEKRSVFTGIDWNPHWTDAPGGVIESIRGGRTFGHAVKAYGWDGDYLILQLSNGTQIGKQGIFTLHRDVINASCGYGAFTLLDLPRVEAEYRLNRIGRFRYWFNTIFS